MRAAVAELPSFPWAQLLERRPLVQILAAIEAYESQVLDLARSLPESVPGRGPEFLSSVGLVHKVTFWERLSPMNPLHRSLPLGVVATDFLREDILKRANVDGRFQHLVANELLRRRATDDSVPAFRAACDALLTEYQTWDERFESRLVATIAREGHYTKSGRVWNLKERDLNRQFWMRQQRAIHTSLSLEQSLRSLTEEGRAATRTTFEDLAAENASLSAAAVVFRDYLDRWHASGGAMDFAPPMPLAGLRTAADWLTEWRSRIDAQVLAHFPETAESGPPRASRPVLGSGFRTVHPREIVRESISSTAQGAMLVALEPPCAANLGIAQAIERARTVVEYGISAGDLYREEALANARVLLERAGERTVAPADAASPVAEDALVSAIDEARLLLELGGPSSLVKTSRRQGLRWGSILYFRLNRGLQQAARRMSDAVNAGSDWVLLRIGWKIPQRLEVPPFMVRPDLDSALHLAYEHADLPGLYRRLFALSPVEDSRFLVGREDEMRALAQALEEWDRGRYATVLLVGPRGSGKTSLLNCATNTLFAGRNVVQGKFHDRLTTAGAVDGFLEPILGSLDPLQRHIIILEEFERTFLRCAGGMAGLRHLLKVVTESSGRILWVFSINNHAVRYLNLATGLDRHFTHRVNAMSIRSEDLRSAILQRHNLSGLRLQFSAPPAGDPRISRARRLLGLERDPETLYFESLFEQSGGVFRSAFELWQSSILRVEAGTVEMGQPIRPDYSALHRVLAQSDHFMLFAVFQHGSLTPEELAVVMAEPLPNVRPALERLIQMMLLEQDPEHPGIRIAPEARQFVHESLHRVNLL